MPRIRRDHLSPVMAMPTRTKCAMAKRLTLARIWTCPMSPSGAMPLPSWTSCPFGFAWNKRRICWITSAKKYSALTLCKSTWKCPELGHRAIRRISAYAQSTSTSDPAIRVGWGVPKSTGPCWMICAKRIAPITSRIHGGRHSRSWSKPKYPFIAMCSDQVT